MDYEWDENKRLANLEKHKLDFADVALLFDDEHLVSPARTVKEEEREIAVGLVADVYVTVVFTIREGGIRIISMRKARNAERKQHQKIHGGRVEGTTRSRREPE